MDEAVAMGQFTMECTVNTPAPVTPTDDPSAAPSKSPTFTGETSAPTTSEPTEMPSPSPTTASPTTASPTYDGYCQDSGPPTDILFGVDGSGSLGQSGWDLEMQFIQGIVDQIVSSTTKIGFTIFPSEQNLSIPNGSPATLAASVVNEVAPLQIWNDQASIDATIANMSWPGGWTNTGLLIAESIQQFNELSDENNRRVLMIVSDGNPCVPDELGGCEYVICQYQSALLRANIKPVIIGIGDGLNSQFVTCLLESTNYFIPVAGFTPEYLNAVMCDGIDSSNIPSAGTKLYEDTYFYPCTQPYYI